MSEQMTTIKETDLDTFTRGYLGCALWSTTDNSDEQGGEPLDANYGIEDMAPEALASAIADCEAFRRDNAADLAEAGIEDGRAGFLFWLNRNGHGSGFWDEGREPVFRRLSDASKVYGTVDAAGGSDERVNLEPGRVRGCGAAE